MLVGRTRAGEESSQEYLQSSFRRLRAAVPKESPRARARKRSHREPEEKLENSMPTVRGKNLQRR